MLDVHAPQETLHGWRDFFVHLITITVGLLIALSLDGCVEWQHHRHLVREAEESMGAEIRDNAQNMSDAQTELHKLQAQLKEDIEVLRYIAKNHKAPENSSLGINFHIHDFKSLSWTTAQSTGALSYMPYGTAEEYAAIYTTQNQVKAAEDRAARDAVVSLGLFLNSDKSSVDPTEGRAAEAQEKIETLQGQLLLVDSMVQNLDGEYRQFLKTHPQP